MTHDSSDIHPLDRDYTQPIELPPKTVTPEQGLRRFGLAGFAVGFILVVLAAVLTNTFPKVMWIESFSSVIHRFAMLTILLGGVILLVSFRYHELRSAIEAIRSWSSDDFDDAPEAFHERSHQSREQSLENFESDETSRRSLPASTLPASTGRSLPATASVGDYGDETPLSEDELMAMSDEQRMEVAFDERSASSDGVERQEYRDPTQRSDLASQVPFRRRAPKARSTFVRLAIVNAVLLVTSMVLVSLVTAIGSGAVTYWVIYLLLMIYFSLLITMIVYHRGMVQAFAVGAMVGIVITLIAMVFRYAEIFSRNGTGLWFGMHMASVQIAGLCCAGYVALLNPRTR